MLYHFYLGLDLGQSKDYTALCVLEEPLWTGEAGEWRSPAEMMFDEAEYVLSLNHSQGRPPDPPLSVRRLERFALGTRYPAIAERVTALLSSAPLRGKRTALLVDATGVGAGVVDHFERAALSPIAVTIHGGDGVGRDPMKHGYRVPKRDLVGAVGVLLQTRRLKVAEGLPESETLKRELSNFRVKIDPKTAHDSYSHWREADHDDLVLATAMACWFREWFNYNLEVRNAREYARRANARRAVR